MLPLQMAEIVLVADRAAAFHEINRDTQLQAMAASYIRRRLAEVTVSTRQIASKGMADWWVAYAVVGPDDDNPTTVAGVVALAKSGAGMFVQNQEMTRRLTIPRGGSLFGAWASTRVHTVEATGSVAGVTLGFRLEAVPT